MRIHYVLFSLFVMLGGMIAISTAVRLCQSNLNITLTFLFSIACFLSTLFMNSELPQEVNYYTFKSSRKKKSNTQEIKNILMERMRTADKEELDELIKKIDELN